MRSRGQKDISEAHPPGVGPSEGNTSGAAVRMYQRAGGSLGAHKPRKSSSGGGPANRNFRPFSEINQYIGLHLSWPAGQHSDAVAFARGGGEQSTSHSMFGVFGAQQRFGLDRERWQEFLVGPSGK